MKTHANTRQVGRLPECRRGPSFATGAVRRAYRESGRVRLLLSAIRIEGGLDA